MLPVGWLCEDNAAIDIEKWSGIELSENLVHNDTVVVGIRLVGKLFISPSIGRLTTLRVLDLVNDLKNYPPNLPSEFGALLNLEELYVQFLTNSSPCFNFDTTQLLLVVVTCLSSSDFIQDPCPGLP